MRNPGRPSQQLSAVPRIAIDCRNRPPPPAALSEDERGLVGKARLGAPARLGCHFDELNLPTGARDRL